MSAAPGPPLRRQAVQGWLESTRFAYVYAVALHSMGVPSLAITVLEDAYRQRPAHRDVLSALVTYLQERGESESALHYAGQLATLLPGDPQVQGLVEVWRHQAAE